MRNSKRRRNMIQTAHRFDIEAYDQAANRQNRILPVLHGEVLGPETITSYGDIPGVNTYYVYDEFAIVNELALRHLGGLFGSPIPTNPNQRKAEKTARLALAYGITPKKGPDDA
jgi:hypothetical protein